MTKKEEILAYLSSIRPKLESEGIEKLGLFGSYAHESAVWGSDIDIVMYTTPRFLQVHPGWEALRVIEELRSAISYRFGGRRVDICDLSGLDDVKRDKLLKEAIYV
ncbi:nucleotidyltransferase family protein [Sulfuricurvum kujiense DSM 16994]|uniref:Nucleotidyltransferase family protein n=1 Tax=Sulfuricurvum kujiense (strain ATCC BAA-921 / DSM 16994 / JCM 11577 / YK-1) TaxID=709032 RepID=E4TYT4_SULKY|nr:nucleotidyltransferase domain-containing protein [Sulfuricurvum kujiense]ADR34075.1 nucleotidyltransferase family protein [Sulfuricurvum kujiense DSM 16994]